MTKEYNEKRNTLNLVHIVYIMAALLIAVGISWGTVTNQQKNHSIAIEKKLSKEVFEIHQTEQRRASEALQKSVDKGFDRLDERIGSLNE